MEAPPATVVVGEQKCDFEPYIITNIFFFDSRYGHHRASIRVSFVRLEHERYTSKKPLLGEHDVALCYLVARVEESDGDVMATKHFTLEVFDQSRIERQFWCRAPFNITLVSQSSTGPTHSFPIAVAESLFCHRPCTDSRTFS